MKGSLIMVQGMREAGHGVTPTTSATLPDLAAYVISIAIVIFMWLQYRVTSRPSNGRFTKATQQ